jgi:prepilin-type N-terminal cleavage/methylation domain-containing protein
MGKNRLKKNQYGFSLIELGVVLALMAVMAAIGVPMMTTAMRDMQLLSDVRSIASTMMNAKMTAASEMTHYRLAFGLANNKWSMDKGTLNGNSFNFAAGSMNQLGRGEVNSGIAFKSNSTTWPVGFTGASSSTIEFNSRGLPTARSIVYVSNRQQDYAVSVSLAGKVQVWKRQNGQWGFQ